MVCAEPAKDGLRAVEWRCPRGIQRPKHGAFPPSATTSSIRPTWSHWVSYVGIVFIVAVCSRCFRCWCQSSEGRPGSLGRAFWRHRWASNKSDEWRHSWLVASEVKAWSTNVQHDVIIVFRTNHVCVEGWSMKLHRSRIAWWRHLWCLSLASFLINMEHGSLSLTASNDTCWVFQGRLALSKSRMPRKLRRRARTHTANTNYHSNMMLTSAMRIAIPVPTRPPPQVSR